jgi:hypothetical protein
MRENSRPVEDLLASQEGFFSVQLDVTGISEVQCSSVCLSPVGTHCK